MCWAGFKAEMAGGLTQQLGFGAILKAESPLWQNHDNFVLKMKNMCLSNFMETAPS